MDTDTGTTTLHLDECWSLLRSVEVGRLAVILADRPDIFPINFLVDHGTILFRTAEGSKLAATLAGKPVAFEVDGYSAEARTAWSVVVKGIAQQIREVHDLFEATALPLFPWHAAPKQHFVRIRADEVTGRRFVVVDPPPPQPPAGHRASPE